LAQYYAVKAHARNVVAQILTRPQASPLTGVLLVDARNLFREREASPAPGLMQ